MNTTTITTVISSATSHIVHAAEVCKDAALVAGHKISAGFATHALPTIKVAWVKFLAVATPAAQFATSPIGLCIIGTTGGALTAVVGISMVVASRGEKLSGDQNKIARRIVTIAGIALTVGGAVATTAGAVGGVALLL